MLKRLAAVLVAVLMPLAAAAAPSPIKHVFVIVLENEDYDSIFGAKTKSPYLGQELLARGALFQNYFATGHASLGNYLAMISGQPESPTLQADCRKFVDVTRNGAPASLDAMGIATGDGCVFPPAVKTIADQLEAAHLGWRGYMEDMGNDPAREASTCARPVPGGDGVLRATPADSYAYRHDPFIYFHSIIDRPANCATHVVRLENLATDLARANTTPAFSFIVPNVCNDGHDLICGDGRRGGLPAADAWLKQWVPQILAAPAFRQDGLLVITFDEASVDSSACCGEPSGPNVTMQGATGPGGGRTGAVLLSPFITGGTVIAEPINHYGLLRSVEDIFGLPPLGYAALPGQNTFRSAYTRP